MNYQQLSENIREKESFLCVGLDSDIQKIPEFLRKEDNPQFAFNKRIIDATASSCIAYKPNLAFYEAQGLEGWRSLEKTVDYIRTNYPDQFIIADAKRGDIGNTSKLYARTFFETFDFDAITVAPYMGSDSVEPFLGYPNKWVILLALTSNAGAADFQYVTSGSEMLYQKVIRESMKWGSHENMMYVVGATKAEMMSGIREIAPDHFLLVPGVGAQGGSLEEVYGHGKNKDTGLLVNASRSIIFASINENFSAMAENEAKNIQRQMSRLL